MKTLQYSRGKKKSESIRNFELQLIESVTKRKYPKACPNHTIVMDYFQNFYVWLISTVMKRDQDNEQKEKPKNLKRSKEKRKVTKAE